MKLEKTHFKDLANKYSDAKLVLPNFQREYIWTVQQQQNLLGSYISKVPIGSYLWIEGSKSSYKARHMCFKDVYTPKKDCLYLLDGQQRISTLYGIFSDIFTETGFKIFFPEKGFSEDGDDWKDIVRQTPNALRRRWFLIFDDSDDIEHDLFGYKNLVFPNNPLLDPREATGLVKSLRITLGGVDDWWRPYWRPDKNSKYSAAMAEVAIAKKCIANSEKLVPLWQLASTSKTPLHKRVLLKIANDRMEELIAVFGGKKDEEIISLLSLAEDKDIVEEYFSASDYESIGKVWITLKDNWVASMLKYLDELSECEYPVVQLDESETDRALAIFETINEGGTPLSVYDLILAKMASAASGETLSQILHAKLSTDTLVPRNISTISSKPKNWCPQWMGVIEDIYPASRFKNAFISMLGITYALQNDKILAKNLKLEVTKQSYLLKIKADAINKLEPKVTNGLIRALGLLLFRCGITSMSELGFQLMILPLATVLSDDKYNNNKKAIDKLEFWYWVTLFSGDYRYRPNERAIEDIGKLLEWIKDTKNIKLEDGPFKDRYDKMFDAPEYDEAALLHIDRSPCHTSLSKAILQFVLSQAPLDLIKHIRLTTWSAAQGKIALEDHHLVPLGSAKSFFESSRDIRKDRGHLLNSPINRTYILKETNRTLGSESIASYSAKLGSGNIKDHMVAKSMQFIPSKTTTDDDYEKCLKERIDDIRSILDSHLKRLLS